VELVIATHKLADPGGSETYTLTVAEHLARLGHSVTLYARTLGPMAQLARERALRVTATPQELPPHADGAITSIHRGLALELAARYPDATRLFVVHSSQDFHLPPPVPGAVAATIVLNDLTAARAGACTCTGEVVRLRQPVDLRRFSPRSAPRERPTRILLLGNYHSGPAERAGTLREAWDDADLGWQEVGGQAQILDVTPAIAVADVVVGYGRSVLEAMACGRPAYIHDQAGSEGWVTPQSYARMEAGGFAVVAARLPPDAQELRADLAAYRPQWGLAGRDLARIHHDAGDHAAALVALLERLGPGRQCAEPSALRALAQLAESQLRAELTAEHYRVESKRWCTQYQDAEWQMAGERGIWNDERAEREHERVAWNAARVQLESERASHELTAIQAQERLAAFRRTRRYRLAQTLAGPLDRLRGRSRAPVSGDREG
jgi:hypothetical protein